MFSLLFQFYAIYYPLTLILPTLFMAVLSDTRLINLRNSHAHPPPLFRPRLQWSSVAQRLVGCLAVTSSAVHLTVKMHGR